MLHYILQTVIFQLLFLIIYDVFFKKETFFNWNRFYLLASAFLSLILPFIKIDSFKSAIPKAYIYVLPEVLIGKPTNTIKLSETILNSTSASIFTFSWHYILYLGCAITLFLFVFKLFKLIKLTYKNPKTRFKNAFLVTLANSKHAFSFFNYIFLGDAIKTEDRETILTHELQHVKEKHSLDLMFFELLKIIFWFNPLIYMYQIRIANLHEFIADYKAIKSSNKHKYYQDLLSQVFDTKKVSFINPFFKQSLIKKRIVMLSKTKSKQIKLAKYLLVFPMVIGMLFYTSCTNESKKVKVEELSVLEHIEFLKQHIDGRTLTKEESEELFKLISQNSEYGIDAFETQTKEENKEISFAVIESVPVFPGCDTSISNKDQKKCFSDKINKLVAQNFNLDLGKKLGLVGKQKIYARFTINKEGNIVNIKTRAPHLELEKETNRVVKLIPQLKPGQQDGKPVNVTFTLPIAFNIKK